MNSKLYLCASQKKYWVKSKPPHNCKQEQIATVSTQNAWATQEPTTDWPCSQTYCHQFFFFFFLRNRLKFVQYKEVHICSLSEDRIHFKECIKLRILARLIKWQYNSKTHEASEWTISVQPCYLKSRGRKVEVVDSIRPLQKQII